MLNELINRALWKSLTDSLNLVCLHWEGYPREDSLSIYAKVGVIARAFTYFFGCSGWVHLGADIVLETMTRRSFLQIDCLSFTLFWKGRCKLYSHDFKGRREKRIGGNNNIIINIIMLIILMIITRIIIAGWWMFIECI